MKKVKTNPTRTIMVTARLDPKLRYLAELAARSQRRMVSSFIEWAIEESLKKITLDVNDLPNAKSLFLETPDLWDIDEADRFLKLASSHPELLTFDEQRLWKLVLEKEHVWNFWGSNSSPVDREKFRGSWETLKRITVGEADIDELQRPESKEES